MTTQLDFSFVIPYETLPSNVVCYEMKNMENINKIAGINSKASELSKLAERMSFVPESIRVMIESHNRMLEEFTKNEIQYICDCYSILCNVHQPNIGITENQVRSLKVKTGITIWLLAYLNRIIED